MTAQTEATLTRAQIRKVLERHRGARAQLARDLGISHVAVLNTLSGKQKSARVLSAARTIAIELIQQEQPTNAA